MKRNKFSLLAAVIVLTASCSVSRKASSDQSITKLRYLGEYILPYKMQFNGTTVGGLSAIDYDPEKNVYYLICDDRSDINPARFYTAKIFFTKGIDSINIVGVTTLKQKNGSPYPNKKQDPFHVPDAEGLRYDAKTKTILWSSEGERIVKQNQVVLINPSVNQVQMDGSFIDTLPLPGNMHMHATENGPRQNGTFEGLAFANHFKTLYVSVEEPIYEDGPRAGLNDSTGWIRIIKYDMNTRQPVAQYAYQIDPVVHAAIPAGEFKINGVPDILAINNHQLLVTERSFSTGRDGCNIRLYIADLNGADDVSSIYSLRQSSVFHPMEKKLLFDMDKLGIYIDNIEGATFGPTLPNGHRSLICVADDNFSTTEKTQFILFEVE